MIQRDWVCDNFILRTTWSYLQSIRFLFHRPSTLSNSTRGTKIQEIVGSEAKDSFDISHQIQNELFGICSGVPKSKIIAAFSAEGTAEISGTAQLSMGADYLHYDKDDKKTIIWRYVPLQELNVRAISRTITYSLFTKLQLRFK